METPEKIAALVKGFRESCKMKAETLAQLSGLSLRTIERVESGKHISSTQTLSLIAKALEVELTVFEQGYWENLQKEIEVTERRKLLVPLTCIESTKSVLDRIKTYHASNYSLEIANDDEDALEQATCFIELIRDACELVEDIPISNIYQHAKEIARIGKELQKLGYQVKIGSYTSQKKTLRFEILLILVLPKDNKMDYALITHQEGWENVSS